MYTLITSKENEELDDKTLDKIGIKKLGDVSTMAVSMETSSLNNKTDGGKPIRKERKES